MPNPRLAGKDGLPCPYCTREMAVGDLKLKPTSDHIRAKCLDNKQKSLSNRSGAARKRGRTIVVCSECNFMKADLTLEQFISYLEVKNQVLLDAVATNTERIMNIRYLIDIGLEKE